MTKVFISYSRKDKLFAGKLTKALEQSDLETWIDWEDIPPTADWLDQIHKGIEESDGFLFLLSPDSVASRVCSQEVDHAVQNAKRLLPIVARDVNPENVHPALAKVNWIYCREQDDFAGAVEKMLTAIRTDLAWVEFHRRLQVRALEWESRQEPSLLLRGRDLREAEEQLASVGQKDPQPTDLQRQYALASRRGESRTRNFFLAIAVVILVVLSLLSVFANEQRILAQRNEETALANAHVASTEKVNAENQKATAIANADLALARQLAAQSQLLGADSGIHMVQSSLLAIESLRRFPTIEGDQALRRNWLLFPRRVSTMEHEVGFWRDVWKIAFSPDGKYIVSASSDRTARVWDTATGLEISHVKNVNVVVDVAFSPDGRHVVSCGGNAIDVWEAATGKRNFTLLHDGDVNSVEYSLDGKFLVSGSSDGTARVWNAATGQEFSRYEHDGPVGDVAFSPDGKFVASAGNDTARVWDVATGNEVAHMNPAVSMFKVAFSPDGRYVVSAGGEMSLVWDAATGEVIARTRQPGNVLAISFSPDGRWVASGSTDGTLLVWEAETGNEIARSMHDWSAGNDPIMGLIHSLAFSPDGRFILTGSYDGTGRVWEAATGTEIIRLAADEYFGAEDVIDGFVNTVAFTSDGKMAALGNSLGVIQVWGIDPDMDIMRMDRGYNAHSNIAISPDGSKVAFGGDAAAVHVWDLNTNREQVYMPPQENIIWTVGFNSDGTRVFSNGSDGLVRIWDATSREEIAAIKYFDVIAFSSRGDWIVSRDADDTARIWDSGTGKEINRLTVGNNVRSLAISLDGKWIVAESGDMASIWEVANGRAVSHFEHPNNITQLAFSPDGNWVVSGGHDGTARIWETTSGREIARIDHDSLVHTVTISPNGRFMASGSGENYLLGTVSEDGSALISHGTLAIWDTVTQKETARISFDSAVDSVVFSPDSKWVTVYGIGNIARIWNVSTGMEISRLMHADYGSMNGLGFSPDGKLIITSGTGGLLKVWLWRPEDMISNLCDRLPRNLTSTEWKLYFGNEPYRAACPNLPIELGLTPTPSP